MAKHSVIRLPDGVIIEISPNFDPNQITAIINSVMHGQRNVTMKPKPEETVRDVEEIWQSSKREKLALFIRNHFSETLWFSAREVMEEQLTIARIIAFGDISQIGTYLKRLHEEGYLARKRGSGRVKYKISENLLKNYPTVSNERIHELILQLQ